MTSGGLAGGLLFWIPVAVVAAMLLAVAFWPGWRRLARGTPLANDRQHAWSLAAAAVFVLLVALVLGVRLLG